MSILNFPIRKLNIPVLVLTLLVVGLFYSSTLVSAAPVNPNEVVCSNLVDPNDVPAVCKEPPSENPIVGEAGLMTKIVQTLVYITGAVAVIMVMVGGFKYMLSNGDSNGIQSAKNTILYALVGLVVAVSGQMIVSFVIARL